jgi:hypothetical protein
MLVVVVALLVQLGELVELVAAEPEVLVQVMDHLEMITLVEEEVGVTGQQVAPEVQVLSL